MYEDETGRRNAAGYTDPTYCRASRALLCECRCATCGRWYRARGGKSGACLAKVESAMNRLEGVVGPVELADISKIFITSAGYRCQSWVAEDARGEVEEWTRSRGTR